MGHVGMIQRIASPAERSFCPPFSIRRHVHAHGGVRPNIDRTDLDKARNFERTLPLWALRELRDLPRSVRGPVESFQGWRARIRAACAALDSGDQDIVVRA